MSSPEDTRDRLIIWGRGRARGEYLAGHVLRAEDFRSVEPIHPQGGPDGVKDFVCYWAGTKCVAACWFPNNSHEKTFGDTKTKFEEDLLGVSKNAAQGFVFITNKELALGERSALGALAVGTGCTFWRIYHLETLRLLLDSPEGVGVRLLVLGIPMSPEEQHAFVESMLAEQRALITKYEQLIEQHHRTLARFVPDLQTVVENSVKNTIEQALALGGVIPLKPAASGPAERVVEGKGTDNE